MVRWLPGVCVLAVVLATGAVPAQDSGSRPADAKKNPPAAAKPSPEPKHDDAATPAASPLRDELGVPADAGKWWVTPEKFKEFAERYQKLQERLSQLERQLKAEKSLPSACKLTARLDGDTLVGKADLLFSTSAPQAIVFLGLKNAFLEDEGKIDDGVPHLEPSEEGYSVRVDEEGDHRVFLNFRIPVSIKRTTGATAGGNERGFELGLPGAAVTTLSLDLGPAIKTVRWNELPANPKSPGHWNLTIGAQKALAVSWKESVAVPLQGPGAKAQAVVDVKIEESRLEIAGKLYLEDPRGPMKEWQLLLPAQARVWPAPGSAPFNWVPPDGKSTVHLIRPTEPAEKVVVAFEAQSPRGTQPQQRVPIGPFLVQNARVQGTIGVQALPDVLRGQRLIYHRFGEISSRDLPPATGGVENLARFQFVNALFGGKGLSPAKAPLEIEWRTELGQIDVTTEHEVRLHEIRGGFEVDVETRFLVLSSSSGLDFLDLQPAPLRFTDLLWYVPQASAGYPAAVRWPASLSPGLALPLRQTFQVDHHPLDPPQPDAQQRLRLKLGRPIGDKATVKVLTQSLLVGDLRRFRIDLPRLVSGLDRGGKVTLFAPSGQDFLVDAHGVEEPVIDKFVLPLDQMAGSLDLSWRPRAPVRFAQALADVHVEEQVALVRQRLTLPIATWGGRPQSEQIALKVPAGVTLPAALATRQKGDRLWLPLPVESEGKYELEVAFEMALPLPRPGEQRSGLTVPLFWPEGTTHREVKVRVWTVPGIAPAVAGPQTWRSLGLEKVDGQKSWPALVAAAADAGPAVQLDLLTADDNRLPLFVAEHTLARATVADDGSESMQFRFKVRRFNTTSLEMELPLAWDDAQPVIRVAGMKVGGVRVVDPIRNRIRLPLAPDLYPTPVLFEIEYQVPAGLIDGKRFWQTPLLTPHFVGEVRLGKVRWAVTLPSSQVPFVPGSLAVDYRMSLQGYLLSPVPTLTSRGLDAWVGATDSKDEPLSLSWAGASLEAPRIIHFSRQTWLVLCSGLILAAGMAVLLLRVPRWLLALAAVLTVVGLATLAMSHDYLLPVLLLGSQPALAVLLLVVGVQWLLHERYRRQLIFMPTFARVPHGSTVVRAAKKRDASTVDAPPVASSAKGPLP